MCNLGKMLLQWADEDNFTEWITQWFSNKLTQLQK